MEMPTPNDWTVIAIQGATTLTLSLNNANDGADTSFRCRPRPPRLRSAWSPARSLRERRRVHRGLPQVVRNHNTRLCVHSAESMVNPRLSVLSSRFQPSRPRLARHYQSKASRITHFNYNYDLNCADHMIVLFTDLNCLFIFYVCVFIRSMLDVRRIRILSTLTKPNEFSFSFFFSAKVLSK